MKITNERDNVLLERKEVNLNIEHSSKTTPSKEEVKKLIVEKYKAKEELVIVKNISTEFGDDYSSGVVYVYDNDKKFQEIEVVRKKKKKGAEGEKPKQEAPKVEEKKEVKVEPNEEEKK
ncbi:hypothetical protein CL617_05625 [archaeon]|nr:hypothetical protein [archaeon]|tara:strand:- start:2799 stop:3155 length:357 start_codon:yes stop_codon:yes gene_type:complete